MLSLLTINWNPDPELFQLLRHIHPLLRFVMDYRSTSLAYLYRATPVPFSDQNRRKEIRTSLLLLLLRYTDRRTTGTTAYFTTGPTTGTTSVEMILPIKQTCRRMKMICYTGAMPATAARWA